MELRIRQSRPRPNPDIDEALSDTLFDNPISLGEGNEAAHVGRNCLGSNIAVGLRKQGGREWGKCGLISSGASYW
jgi:hypothetical protein